MLANGSSGDCCHDLYTVTRALAELAFGSSDPRRIAALRARVALRVGAAHLVAALAIGDAESGIVPRSKIHVCRICRMCAAPVTT